VNWITLRLQKTVKRIVGFSARWKHLPFMMRRELQQALDHLAELEAVLAKSHGGWADEDSLLEFRRVCGQTLLVAGDSGCHEHIDLLVRFARDLYSDRGHHRWDIGPVFGADILRRKIRMTLRACRARLNGEPPPVLSSRARGLPGERLQRALRASPT
jgi:hypothetical protein